MCGAYLWKGSLEGHHSARVAWEEITHAKEEGGLGVRDLSTWNKVCSMKVLWLLFFRSGSIWVAWFKREILSGCISNFWTLKENNNHSWMVKRLLRLRETVYPWVKISIGNGRTCNFWVDNWSPFGSLASFLQLPRSSRLGIPARATLADLNIAGNWILPPARSEQQVLLHIHLSTLVLSEEEDSYEWWFGGRKANSYSTCQVYRDLKHHNNQVDWNQIVWIKSRVPRHSFLTWLFMLNRCPTRDRLLNWGLATQPDCLLCNSSDESRSHLFFSCSYSWQVWSLISAWCNLSPPQDWDQCVAYLRSMNGSRTRKLLSLLAWKCTIYHLWTERNNRLHRNRFKSSHQTAMAISAVIRSKSAAFRDRSSRLAFALFSLWNSD